MGFLAPAGLVMILVGVASHYATRSLSGFSAFSLLNVAAGAALLLAGGVWRARRFRGFSGAASRRVASAWVGALALALVAVIGVDLLAKGWSARVDLTRDRLYTLSDQTKGICRELAEAQGEPIDLVFFEDALLAKDVRLLVDAYGADCPSVRIRDASRDEPPAGARGLFRTTATTVIACRGAVCDPVGYPSERNITSALLRLGSARVPRVYFLVGHGEVDLASQAEDGYSGLAGTLRGQGFDVQALVGPAAPEVPADADALVVAGPERDLLPQEIAYLDAWLARGGRVLALAEPGLRSNFYGELLARWGFALPDAVVLDAAASPLLRDARPMNLLVHLFAPYNPVTRTLSQRTMVLLPGARPVELARKPAPDDRLERVAFASRRAWLEPDVAAARAGRSTRPVDAPEVAIPVAATGTYPRPDGEARVVVIGDCDFVSNRLLEALYNRDLFLNALRWLVADEARIALGDKAWTPNQDPLTLQQTVAYFYFLAFALPEALLLLGIYAWWRRRS